MADNYSGALSRNPMLDQSMLDKLSQGIDDPSRKWDAFSAGALAGKSGYAGTVGNAMAGMLQQQNAQDTLKAQYVPHIAAAIDNAQKNAMAMEKMRRDFEMQDYFKKMFLGGDQGTVTPSAETGQLGSGTYDIMPTANGAPSIPAAQNQQSNQPSGGGKFPLDLNGVAFAKMFMGKDLSPEYKMAMEGFEKKPGSAYDMPGRGMQWMPDPKTGFMGYDAQGNIIQSGNFNKLAGDTAGATALAQETAKNKQTLLPPAYVGKGGTPLGGTVSEYINPQEKQQASNAGFPAGTVLPSSDDSGTLVPGQSDRLSILQQELASEKDPQNIAALKRDIARMQSSTSQDNSQSIVSGRPQLQSEAEKEAQVGPIKIRNAIDEANLKNYPEYVKQKQNALASMDQMKSVIGKAINHPGLSTATGASGVIDPRNYFAGTNATNFRVLLDQIKGGTFLQAFERLRGGGQITEVEGKKATDAIGRLERAQSEDEFKVSLHDLNKVVDGAIDRINKTPDPVELSRNRANDNSMKESTYKVRRYNPATGKIE